MASHANEPGQRGNDFDIIGAGAGENTANDETDQSAIEPASDGGEVVKATCSDCGRDFERDSEEAVNRALNSHQATCTGEGSGGTKRELERRAAENGPLDAEEALDELDEIRDGDSQ